LSNLYDAVLPYDDLAPIERMDALIVPLSIDRQLLETILLTLEAIDTTIARLLVEGVPDSSRNFYVCQDQSVKLLLEQVAEKSVAHKQFTEALLLLNETDLIFRFTAARKFAIEDSSVKQLRINSWGKLYIETKALLAKYDSLYKQLTEQMTQFVLHDKSTYQEITELLSQPIQPSTAKRIAELNAKLTVRLLS
jgi:hypothetical protein